MVEGSGGSERERGEREIEEKKGGGGEKGVREIECTSVSRARGRVRDRVSCVTHD